MSFVDVRGRGRALYDRGDKYRRYGSSGNKAIEVDISDGRYGNRCSLHIDYQYCNENTDFKVPRDENGMYYLIYAICKDGGGTIVEKRFISKIKIEFAHARCPNCSGSIYLNDGKWTCTKEHCFSYTRDSVEILAKKIEKFKPLNSRNGCMTVIKDDK